ncbi:hypothetical protein RND81_07G068100 [Saponaria officinalis]|uniref:Uncharacterized protein n=1 Tax=Saponaria officinalis TaxID=3572 RepID=A0AAW1JRL1_SAPOF
MPHTYAKYDYPYTRNILRIRAQFTYAFLSFASPHQLNRDFEVPLTLETSETHRLHDHSCTEECDFLHHLIVVSTLGQHFHGAQLIPLKSFIQLPHNPYNQTAQSQFLKELTSKLYFSICEILLIHLNIILAQVLSMILIVKNLCRVLVSGIASHIIR